MLYGIDIPVKYCSKIGSSILYITLYDIQSSSVQKLSVVSASFMGCVNLLFDLSLLILSWERSLQSLCSCLPSFCTGCLDHHGMAVGTLVELRADSTLLNTAGAELGQLRSPWTASLFVVGVLNGI